MLGMKNHFDISGSIEIREVDIAGVACNWYCLPEFFSNIISFSYFLDRQNPDFFLFQFPNFSEPVLSNLRSPISTLITGLKHAVSPYFNIAVLQYLAIFYENLH